MIHDALLSRQLKKSIADKSQLILTVKSTVTKAIDMVQLTCIQASILVAKVHIVLYLQDDYQIPMYGPSLMFVCFYNLLSFVKDFS